MKNIEFLTWWGQVNDVLEDQGREQILYGHARDWHLAGLSVDEAVQRELENLESAQEERSYYDA